jgi:hypothetical protein
MGQAGGHVRQSEEHRVPYDVEEGGGHQARPLPDHLAVLLPAAVPAILRRVVVGLAVT